MATWKVIEALYKNEIARPIRMCPHLTAKHIYLPFGCKMKVSYAVQVLSHSTKSALNTLVDEGILDKDFAAGTIEFISKMNDLWDIVNSSKVNLKSLKTAITSTILEQRIAQLEEMKLWITSLRVVDPMTRKQKPTFPFQRSWYITLTAFQKISKMLLVEQNLKFVMLRRFNQDVVENLFSQCRLDKGGLRSHPNSVEALQTLSTLAISMFMTPHKSKTNCEADGEINLLSLHSTSSLLNDTSHNSFESALVTKSYSNYCDEIRSAKSIGLKSIWLTDKIEGLPNIDRKICEYITGAGICKMKKKLNCNECISKVIDIENTENNFICNKNYCPDRKKGLLQPTLAMSMQFYTIENIFRKKTKDNLLQPKIKQQLSHAINSLCQFTFLPSCHRKFISDFLINYYLNTRIAFCCKLANEKIINCAKMKRKLKRLNVPHKTL